MSCIRLHLDTFTECLVSDCFQWGPSNQHTWNAQTPFGNESSLGMQSLQASCFAYETKRFGHSLRTSLLVLILRNALRVTNFVETWVLTNGV